MSSALFLLFSLVVVVVVVPGRYEILDPALVRPGRFDRIVRVELPDARGRRDILAVHVRRQLKLDLASGAPNPGGISLEVRRRRRGWWHAGSTLLLHSEWSVGDGEVVGISRGGYAARTCVLASVRRARMSSLHLPERTLRPVVSPRVLSLEV